MERGERVAREAHTFRAPGLGIGALGAAAAHSGAPGGQVFEEG